MLLFDCTQVFYPVGITLNKDMNSKFYIRAKLIIEMTDKEREKFFKFEHNSCMFIKKIGIRGRHHEKITSNSMLNVIGGDG